MCPSDSSDRVAVYVHVPFCVRKCRYCAFFSVPVRDGVVLRYLDALKREMAARVPSPVEARSIYIGGGTPTCLRPAHLGRLLETLLERVVPVPGCEFTVEANPGTLSRRKCVLLREAGVNRLSIGAQSFDERRLAFLGRSHSARDVFDAIDAAGEAGVENVGLDLIYGLPSEEVGAVVADLDRALGLRAKGLRHLSCYMLTVERGTPLARDAAAGRVRMPADETLAELYRAVRRRLVEAGLRHYEISNFAVPGGECLHNLACWRYEPFVGFGPSAVSFDGREWRAGTRSFRRYFTRPADAAGTRRPSPPERGAECLVLGLRTAEGVPESRLLSVGGARFSDFEPALSRLIDDGLLERCGDRLLPTERGWLFHDTVGELLIR